MEIVSNADLLNVACGFHAGDASQIIRTIQHGANHHKLIGAHPSFPDLQGFGRRYMDMEQEELQDVIFFQIATIHGICSSLGTSLHHVKAHGALYNAACHREKEATALISQVIKFGKNVALLAPAGSLMAEMATAAGIMLIKEGFADRKYLQDLTLMKRSENGSILLKPEEVLKQYETICQGFVYDVNNQKINIEADTICIHGDHPHLSKILKLFHESRN